MQILLSSVAANLTAAIAGLKSVTVEAEYGDSVVEGSHGTLAHHGSRSANPAPCTFPNRLQPEWREVEVIGLSHVDLDALGGVLAVLGTKPNYDDFWTLAAFVDTKGPHKLAQSGASEEDLARLYAFWAWSEKNKLYAPRDGSVVSAEAWVDAATIVLWRLFLNDPELIEAGAAAQEAQLELNRSSFRGISDQGVIAREAEAFTNHLYLTPGGKVAKAVVSYNAKSKAVTISLADPIPGVSCVTVAQELWGPEAGGHAGIAGGPRSGLPREEMLRAIDAMNKLL